MPRFLRIILKSTTLLSAILCLATTIVWIRSYRYIDEYASSRRSRMTNTGEDASLNFFSGLGEFSLQYAWFTSPIHRPADWPPINSTQEKRQWHTSAIPRPIQSELNLSFYFGGTTNSNRTTRSIVFPYWSLFILTNILPFISIIRRLRRFLIQRAALRPRRHSTLCQTCGYDLRATPHHCPECGTIPPKIPS